MQTECNKWGNSLAIRIPKLMAGEIGLEEGSLTDLSLENGKLVIRPIKKQNSLNEMLASWVAAGGDDFMDEGEETGREAVEW